MNVSRLMSAIALVAILVVAGCAAPPTATPLPPAPTSVPPTAVPATAVPPTAVPPTAAPAPAPATSFTLTLGPGRDATQAGTVTFTAKGNQTEVVLNLQGAVAGVAQPAHIHEGVCPGVGAVKFPLTNAADGKSTTTVDAPLASLLTGGFAVNAHESTTNAGKYVACVGIPAGAVIALDKGRDADETPATAVLLANGAKTDVWIFKKPGPAGVAQPGHIHEGACPAVGAVKYPLTNTVDGKSSTTIDATLASVQAGGFSINLHKSAAEVGVYIACGAIPRKATSALAAGRDGDQSPGTVVLVAQGSKTEVTVNIKPGAKDIEQPVHIHDGACPAVGAVKFPLKNIVNGTSTTVVDATVDDLLKGGYSVNAHLSAAEVGKYVACGALK